MVYFTFRPFRRPLLLLSFLLGSLLPAMAQTGGGVGIGGTAPASAALSVSSTTKGFLPPRMTQAQRDLISAPTAGLVIYNTTTNKLNTWNGTSWDASLSATEQVGSAVSSFAYTGAPQTFVVPAGVTSLQVTAEGGAGGQDPYGAGSGAPGQPGGVGGRVTATLTVTPGETLTVYVGGKGSASSVGTSPGGYNGGGTGDEVGGSGGGATDLRRATATADAVGLNRLLVAGGGGGGGYNDIPGQSAGGNGGAPTGSNGQDGPISFFAGGRGGTQSGPGGNANANIGGDYRNARAGGGAGGGGYYGGGGAAYNAGGGGGSSWVTPTGSSGISYGVAGTSADGSLTITYPSFAAPVLDGANFVNVPGTFPQLSLSGQSLTISNGNTVTLPASTDAQQLNLNGQSLTISNGNTVTLPASTDAQQLNLNGQSLTISNGNTVTLPANIDTDTDAQQLSLNGQSLTISGGNTVTLPASIDTDAQQLSKSGNLISLTNGGSVVDADNQQITKSGNLISLTNGGSVADADNQSLSLSGSSLSIGGGTGVTLPDASSTNELQSLSLSGSTLGISGGAGVTLPDVSSTNELQNLSLSGSTLGISGGSGVTLPDVSSTNEIQSLSLSGQNLTISGSNTVTLPASTDAQQLSVSGQNLTISGGNTVALPSGADNLGNHTATTSINLGSNLLRQSTGATSGISLTLLGAVGINAPTPATSAQLEVRSTVRGFLPPRMTTTERDAIASPATGLVIYNTTTNRLSTWDGGAWNEPVIDSYQPPTQTFGFTGAPQTYVVPVGVTQLAVTAIGGRGGNNGTGASGGAGARVTTTLTVTPGETLNVYVGGIGSTASATPNTPGGGGYNGGGNAYELNGGGGGASDVRRGTSTTFRVVVAAGGGGAASGVAGGAGGAPNGAAGSGLQVGQGATQTGGGTGYNNVGNGTFGQGGSASTLFTGGGGGYYGGGAGGSGGAGGGSSWVLVNTTANTTYTAGVGTGAGSITLTPAPVTTAPILDGSNFVNLPWQVNGSDVYRATGNVGIGTSTPAQKLDVVGNIAASGPLGVVLNSQDRPLITRGYDAFSSGNYSGAGRWGLFMESSALTFGVPAIANRQFQWATYNANSTVGTSLMTLSQSGDLSVSNSVLARGFGSISNQGAYLQWNRSLGEGETWLLNQKGSGNVYAGIRFGSATSANVITEWARFIDNGNLGLGTTTPDAKLDIESSGAQQLILTSTASDPTGVITINIPATNPACATCSEMIIFNKAGTGTIGAIGANVANNTVYYNTALDKRLKEHIRPTHYGLPDLLKIEVKDYNFIGTAAANRTTGFLAQDLFRIYPEAVKEGDTGATVTNMWAVDYGKLTPLLVQAIQD